MRPAGFLVFLAVAAFSAASCSDEPPPSDDEGTVCPEDLINETQLIQDAVTAFDAYVDRHLKAATPACVAIIDDLGGTPPPTSPTNPTVEELGAACQMARQVVVTEVMNQAVFSITIPDVTCDTTASQDACALACGFGQACDNLCPALATLETPCPTPDVMVMAATVFKDTLEANLPQIAPLAHENPDIQAAVSALNSAFTTVLTGLNADPLCAAERDAVSASQMLLGPIQTEHSTAAGTVANFLTALPD